MTHAIFEPELTLIPGLPRLGESFVMKRDNYGNIIGHYNYDEYHRWKVWHKKHNEPKLTLKPGPPRLGESFVMKRDNYGNIIGHYDYNEYHEWERWRYR
jgi:hypothetical protein